MPRGRKPAGETSLSNAERQARYRSRHPAPDPSVVIRTRRPVDRRSRPRRWHDAVAELVELQVSYAAWLEALPDTLQGTATADRPLSISTSTCLPRSSRPGATAAIDGAVGRTAVSWCWVRVTASRAALRAPAGAGCGP
jgi:hypothetical protein